jgi:hypothetical protein
LKNPNNRDGSDIRVIVSSPKISEGVDFRYIRQIHILDPWFNMSRIEQVVGRGMRTCSHSLLPFEKQNCTVYFHVCRYADSDRETYDEYIYRVFVEEKGEKIARVKQIMMESAMDCSLNEATNSLPKDWREDLKIPQVRSQDGEKLHLNLIQMSAPTFEVEAKLLICNETAQDPDPQHVRPLSAFLDVREEIFDKLNTMFEKKSIWAKDDIFSHSLMKQYDPGVLSYTIQTAISNSVKFHDKLGRTGILESKGDMLALSVNDSRTMLDRVLKTEKPIYTPLEKHVRVSTIDIQSNLIEKKRKSYGFPTYIESEFTDDVLNWYIIDHALSEDERLQYMMSIDWTNPPIYAAPLKIMLEDGKKLYVLGLNKIFNELKELTTPIGKEKQEYDKWVEALKTKFVENSSSFFAAMKDGKIVFNVDETSEELKVVRRSKDIGGRACTSYHEGILNNFAEWLGVPFAKIIKGKKDRCMFLDLLIRKMVIEKKPELFWITPEEWEILKDQKKNVKALIKNR